MARPGATCLKRVIDTVIFREQSPKTMTEQIRSGPGKIGFCEIGILFHLKNLQLTWVGTFQLIRVLLVFLDGCFDFDLVFFNFRMKRGSGKTKEFGCL